ncbi:MAG: hypothetical protein HY774_27010 [Acidobacteria bacterium]|nr:hypothetical protein [Acidobacteriota bacterium]
MRRLFLVSLLLISGLFFTFSLASLSRQSAEAGSNLPHLVNPSFSLSSPIFPSLRVKQNLPGGQAVSRRAPSINGRLEGSIQQLTPENVTLNGGATITEKLYVPGTPTVRRNGNPNFGGVIDGSGSAIPTNYQVTLNGNATLGNLVNRTNPVALTPVLAPPTPTGTRDVSLNNPNDQIGDFATLRNLTLNGNAGTRSVPAGTYGNFTVNGSSILIFGVANAVEPAVYNLQGLTLNGGTQLQIVGPVTLTLRNGTNINGSIGNAANPQWLTLNISNGGVTLNGGSQMFGKVNAPAGSVTVNSRLTGNVICDRLTVNGGGVVTILAQAPQDTTAPVITIAEPAQGLITKTSPITVSGTVTDSSAVTVTINGQPITLSGAQFSTPVTLAEGSNTITVLATDTFGNVGTATRNVTLDTTAPVLTVTSPQDGATTTETQLTITGTVTDATTTTVTVNNVAATRIGNEFSAVVSLVEGPNTFIIRAEDAARNKAETTRTVTLQVQQDTTPPVITITEPAEGLITNLSPVTVSGTVTDASTVTVTVNNQPAPLSGTQFTASVTLIEGSNTIAVSATDAFGNASSASRSVVLDTAAPVLTITSPEDGATTTESQITVIGTVTDATATTVTVNNVPATRNGNEFSVAVPLVEGTNLLQVQAMDISGNTQILTFTVTRTPPLYPLSLTVSEPVEGSIHRENPLTIIAYVKGSSLLAGEIRVSVNGMLLPVKEDGSIIGQIPVNEGTNFLQIVATDVFNTQVQESRTVVVDTIPPVFKNLTPPSRSQVTERTAIIRGQVSDLHPVDITVNGLPVIYESVSGTETYFRIENLPLNEGLNSFFLTATDQAGNTGSSVLLLFGVDRTPPEKPMLFPILSPTSLSFQVIGGQTEPASQIRITGINPPITTQATTDTGMFLITVPLESGTNTFDIMAVDQSENNSPAVQVVIESNPSWPLPLPGQPFQVNISTGGAQKGLRDTPLPRPFVTTLTDTGGNPVSGQVIVFKVLQGDGRFDNGQKTNTVLTDAQGRAAIQYTTGSALGVQLVQATFENNFRAPVYFFCTVIPPSINNVTSYSGRVVDQNLRSLPNVLVRLGGQQSRTDSRGEFTLKNVSSGPHQLLEVIGRDEVSLPGRWPNISYDVDILPGVDNHFERPLFLPKVNEGILLPLDENNVVTQDTTYELPVVGGQPPIQIVAKAGTQVLFPPDITDKRFSVTRIPTNRVPMALEDGRYTNLYISVQPSGALFDPPLQVTFPNIDHQPPYSRVLLMSFDHDAGRYVQVGTGQVSGDGQTISSDPTSGIHIGAWHGFPPEAPLPDGLVSSDDPDKCNSLPSIQMAGNTQSRADSSSCYSCKISSSNGGEPTRSGNQILFVSPSGIPERFDAVCEETPKTALDILQSDGVPMDDSSKQGQGGYVPVNNDDDNYNGTVDRKDTGLIEDENDLIKLRIRKIEPIKFGGQFALVFASGNIKLWKNEARTEAVTSGSFEFDASQEHIIYVEGILKSANIMAEQISLDWKDGNKTRPGTDKISITVYQVSGPINVPGYSTYLYKGDVPGGKAGTWDAQGGTIKSGDDLHSRNVTWSEGPLVGKVLFSPIAGFTCAREVNVVRVKLSEKENKGEYRSNPIQRNGAGSPLISSSESPGDPEKRTFKGSLKVEAIEGPLVKGKRRGAKYLELGTAHTALFTLNQAYYEQIKKRLRNVTYEDGFIHWDVLVSETIPYEFVGPEGPRDGEVTFYGPENDEISSVEFKTGDSPATFGTDPKGTDPNGKFVINGDQVDKMCILMKHYLYVVVAVSNHKDFGEIGSHKVFTQRAKLNWFFDGTGDIDQGGNWRSTPISEGNAIQGDKFFKVLTGSEIEAFLIKFSEDGNPEDCTQTIPRCNLNSFVSPDNLLVWQLETCSICDKCPK